MPNPLNDLLQQAQAVAGRASQLQEELKHRIVEAQAGGGLVTAKANGARELVALEISPKALGEVDNDVDMLSELVVAAVNEALNKASKMAAEEMQKLTGGMNIPGLFG